MQGMNPEAKEKAIRYLKQGQVIAVAAGYPKNRKTGEEIREEFLAYSDGVYDWTTEDILNFELNDELFNKELIMRAIITADRL